MAERPEPLVLIVDDDASIRIALDRALRLEGLGVVLASGGEEALEAVEREAPAVMVLDITMPDIDGRVVAARLRARGDEIPICVLSARDEVEERVAGLEAGADDYLVKPFAVAELVARVRALLRRRPAPPGGPVVVGPVRLDAAAREASVGGEAVLLTRREFELLECFARHPGVVLTRGQLLEQVWGYDFEVNGNVVDVFVGYLRRKLEAGGHRRLIETVRGVGFVFRP